MHFEIPPQLDVFPEHATVKLGVHIHTRQNPQHADMLVLSDCWL